MSEDNFIEVEFKILDFEECINKSLISRNMTTDDDRDPTKSTKNKPNKYFVETKTVIGLENKSSNNFTQNNCTVSKSLDNDSITDIKNYLDEIKPRFNSEIITSLVPEIANNLYNNKEQIKNNTESYCENNTVPNNEVISIRSGSSLTHEVKIELLNTIPPESLDDSNFNELYGLGNDSDGSGYHSSDFEFISENEAIEGLIKNNHYNKLQSISNFPSGLVSESLNCNPNPDESKSFSRKKHKGRAPSIMNLAQSDLIYSNAGSTIYRHSLGHGPSSYSHLKNHDQRDPNDPGPSTSNNSQNNHPMHNAVPHEEEYFDLFRGMYNPALPLCDIHMMENKSFRTTSMNVEFEGIGFDMRLMRNMDGSSQDEFESEAEENAKKILQMYPGDNRKRRRRH